MTADDDREPPEDGDAPRRPEGQREDHDSESSIGLKPSADKAVEFLEAFRPGGPWIMTAIGTDRPFIQTRTFDASSTDALRDWLAAQDEQRRNVYFHVNSAMRALDKKAEKTDIATVDWLHVDIDPAPGFDLREEQKTILAALQKAQRLPPPTMIVFSGGGYQGFWKLREPIEIKGDLAKAEDAERYNQQVELLLGADPCHNVDRIMRVPGTVNYPCEKKRRKGRQPALATLVMHDPARVYPISAFTQAPKRQDAVTGGGTVPVQVSGNVRRIAGVAPEDGELPPEVSKRCREVIVHGRDNDQALTGDNSRSAWLFWVCCELVRAEVDDETIYAIITDPDFGISSSVLDKGNSASVHRYAVRQIQRAKEQERPITLKGNFRRMAETFRDHRYPTLLRTNGDYLDHTGAHYVEIEEDTAKAELWSFLDAAKVQNKDDEQTPFPLSKKRVGEVWEPFQLLVHMPRRRGEGHQWWLRDADGRPPAGEVLALPNGLLHVPTRALLPHTPDFFTRNLINIQYDAGAGVDRWGTFLEELWPDDPAQRQLLQEIIGYLLIPDTSLQKMFFIKGPRRSGKGTILRTINDLVGQHNVTGLSLNRVNQGTAPLEPLLGKLVWLISDLRLENRSMPGAVEKLLNITGEDWLSVERKYKPAWEGVLPARIFMAANKVPRLNDPSGALAGRIVALETEASFWGKEDSRLQDKLRTELPGILNWALDGWSRLQHRRRFELPAKGRALVDSIYRTGSHVVAFLEDCCVEDLAAKVSKDDLFSAYRMWCQQNDVRYTLTKEDFGSEVAEAKHGIVKNGQRLSVEMGRAPAWGGIRLKADAPRECF